MQRRLEDRATPPTGLKCPAPVQFHRADYKSARHSRRFMEPAGAVIKVAADMKRTIAIVIILVLLTAGVFGLYRYTQSNSDLVQQTQDFLHLTAPAAGPSGPPVASGILEARTVAVSSDLGGRVAALHVAEGDTVHAGQPLLTLDDSLLRPRIAQVEAAVAAAQARLELVQAGARPEQIALAQARLAQAEAATAAAQQAWDDAKLLRDTPQELDVQIVEAETAVSKAEHQATAARRLAEAADLQTALWGRVTELLQQGVDVPLPTGGVFHVDNPAERNRANTQWNLSGQQAWEAWQTALRGRGCRPGRPRTAGRPAPHARQPPGHELRGQSGRGRPAWG